VADLWVKQGDTAPPVVRTLKDFDENPVNLTDADVVFNMRRIHGDQEPVIEAGVVDIDGDPTSGVVTYEWQPGDTDEAGGFYGEFEVTFDDGSVETFPNDGYVRIAIVAELGSVAS
jgi:hypothetical protein